MTEAAEIDNQKGKIVRRTCREQYADKIENTQENSQNTAVNKEIEKVNDILDSNKQDENK